MEVLSNAYHYVESHWLVISMVYIPAGLGYLNAFVASARVLGWKKFADSCGKIEEAVEVFITTLRNQRKEKIAGGSVDDKNP